MGRAPCCDKSNVKKGPWSPEEDAKLKDYIEKYGTGGNWTALPQKIGLKRCGKSCRLRWLNYLRPNIKHGGFSEEEDELICRLYIGIGSRWSIIAAQLPGRTDNDVKNYWNTKLKKKLLGRANQVRNNNNNQDLNHLNQDEKSRQALSNSAMERLQLHKQLQRLQNPLSFYNNPLSWPTIQSSLQDKVLQPALSREHEEQKSENSGYALQENYPRTADYGVLEPDSSFNAMSASSDSNDHVMASTAFPRSDSFSDPSNFLESKNLSFTDQEEQRAYLFDCFKEMNESKESSVLWSYESDKKPVSESSWDSSSVFQMGYGL